MTRILLLVLLLAGCAETETREYRSDPPMISIELGSKNSQPERILVVVESDDGTQECAFEIKNGGRIELRLIDCWELERKIEI